MGIASPGRDQEIRIGLRLNLGSKSGSQKAYGNVIRYEYPAVDLQEGLCPESCIGAPNGDNDLDESSPIVIVDSKETQMFAYVDQTPSTKSLEADYN